MSALQIDVFWSFRSPWSYLAAPRLLDWSRRYDLGVRLRPLYPIILRTPGFFENRDPLWFSYFMTDLVRVAEFLDLPFAWARPDPVVSRLSESGWPVAVTDQPYIHRLTRLGVLAEEAGRGIDFATAVSRLIWGGTENWHQGSLLSVAVADAGLDLANLDRSAVAEEERLEQVICDNEAAHKAVGHWGVPTCAFQGEPFFGQDRLDVLQWRLRQHGLRERDS